MRVDEKKVEKLIRAEHDPHDNAGGCGDTTGNSQTPERDNGYGIVMFTSLSSTTRSFSRHSDR